MSNESLRDRIADALHGHFELEAIGPMGCRHEQGSDEEHVADVMLEVLRTDKAVERLGRLLACLEPGEEWPSNEALGGNLTGTRDHEYRDGMRDQAREAIDALLGEAV